MSDGIRRVAQMVRTYERRRATSKANRTHALSEPQYSKFAHYCRVKGIPAGEVLDQLIGEFLTEVADDIQREIGGDADEKPPSPPTPRRAAS